VTEQIIDLWMLAVIALAFGFSFWWVKA